MRKVSLSRLKTLLKIDQQVKSTFTALKLCPAMSLVKQLLKHEKDIFSAEKNKFFIFLQNKWIKCSSFFLDQVV